MEDLGPHKREVFKPIKRIKFFLKKAVSKKSNGYYNIPTWSKGVDTGNLKTKLFWDLSYKLNSLILVL